MSAKNTSSRVELPHADVVDLDPRGVELAHRDRDEAVDLPTGITTRRPSCSTWARRMRIDASAPIAARRRRPRVDQHLDLLATDAALQLGGRAPLDHHAVVDDRDLVGEAVGFVEVLRGEQRGHPAAARARR